MEPREDTEKMSVTEAEVVQQEAADDNEGFQPVTNKKNEKLKEKETQREKEAKKKSKRGKKVRSSKDKDKLKEKDREKERDAGTGDSKESSPTPSKSEEPVEFVPAPPPKTNPWKKSSKPETADPASSNTASASSEPADKPKPKAERKKKLSEREVKEKTDHGNPKGNPWKKVEAAKEPEVPSSPKVIKVEKKSGEPSSWPKLGEEKNKKKKKSTENWSGDSGAASSLDTAEEGKENQVCELL